MLLFGPEGLPLVARKAGKIMRDVQNTSQAFVREMERAADLSEVEVARRKSEVLPLHAGPAQEDAPFSEARPPEEKT